VQGERDTAGRSTAIAVITPARRWWAAWLKAEFAYVAALKRLLRQREPSRPIRKLSFITFAHWALLERVPAGAGARGARKLPYPYILFQSNFNGAPAEYFEAFARGLKWRMRSLWKGAYGVPDAADLDDFATYIDDNWVHAEHYYCAYPSASTKMVLGALEVRKQFDEFSERFPQMDPTRFRDEFDAFVAKVQAWI
jgi:hypothetical protein